MLLFEVNGQKLTRKDRFEPATDSVEYLKAQFTFKDSDWNGKAKTALFRVGVVSYSVLLDGSGTCKVPAEVLVRSDSRYARIHGSKFHVSLVGTYGTTRITTNELETKLNTSGFADAETPAEPTEGQYEQILTACADAQTACDEAKAECQDNRNILANALKGKKTGEIVAADDVSPVEHSPAVRVHGKNLFDTSKIAVQANTDNIYISAVGEGYIDITTKEAYDGNGHCVTWVKLKELCPQMQAGKQYALSGTTTAWNKMIYLKEIDLFWSYGSRLVVTEEMLECTIGFYGLNSLREQGFGTCRISNIQCEEGYDITDYTPYIDPATVTVRRCGKNIFGVAAKSQTINGVTFTVNADGSVTAKGTATKATFIGLGSLVLKPDEKYRLSGSPAGSGFDTYLLYIHNNTTGADIYDLGEGKVFTGKEGDLGVTIAVYAGNTVNNLIFRPMVVYGEESGTFEPYNGTSYIPAADGTVPGMTSLSPNMTILTDTDGVIVECEYIQDTNKVIEKLVNAVIALGGTV